MAKLQLLSLQMLKEVCSIYDEHEPLTDNSRQVLYVELIVRSALRAQ